MKRFGIVLLFVFSILVNVYFGFQKAGFHEDEYYTYFSTNRSIGLYQPDREWQDRQTILDEFTVKQGEGFNYSLVKLVQSWDVHPPLYYYIFHTICSFIPGVFTKWTGIITNLLAFSLSFLMIYKILELFGLAYEVRLIALGFWAVNPQTVSCNMLTRMYAWLTFWIFLCAYLHLRLIQNTDKMHDLEVKEKNSNVLAKWLLMLLPIMIVSFMGFLTQYFYLFFFVSIGFAFTVWLIFFRKEILKAVVYVGCCAFSLALAVLYYPASVHHMFGGYRGTEAAGSLFSISNTVMRISFFCGLLSDFVFAGLLPVLLVVILVVSVYMKCSKKKSIASEQENKESVFKQISVKVEFWVLAFGVLGYFLLTAKSALLVGAASNRYEMPIYGLVIVIVFFIINSVLKTTGQYRGGTNKADKFLFGVIFLISVMILLKGICLDKRVLFLYPEDKQKTEYAVSNHDDVAIVAYNPVSSHNVWHLTDELLCYDKVYYMDEENTEAVGDSEICTAEKIILYIADDEKRLDTIENIQKSSGLENLTIIDTEEMWTTYELTK